MFSAGDNTVIFNNTTGNIAITTSGTSGMTLYYAGTSALNNRTLATRGLATILCVASNTFAISGAGLT